MIADRSECWRSRLLVPATVMAIVAGCAVLAMIGADARWLVALGHTIVRTGSIPSGVPFASAPTGHWPNTLVLAELVFNALQQALGDRGLVLAQLLAVGTAMGVVALDARAAGAGEGPISRALLIAALGAAPSLVIVRVQLFSLALFPIVCALVRADARRASRRIWLVVPVLALWSNLHGGALLGLGVVLAYALLAKLRRQPLAACALAVAAAGAMLLTPALLATVGYYHGLLTNVAAQRGQGMWGPLSPTAPFDVILVAAAVALAWGWRRARPPAWELAVAAAIAVMAVRASREGVWLLLFLAPQAAVGFRARAAGSTRRVSAALTPAAALAALAVICFAVARGPVPRGADPRLLARAITLAHGSPILATDGVDEQVAAAGGRVWAGDPIDAFTRQDQAEYLDFSAGSAAGRRVLSSQIQVVLVSRGSASLRLMGHTDSYARAGADGNVVLYLRRDSSPTNG